jgi:glycine/D-amino acid oxidase-like deaminating enzyme
MWMSRRTEVSPGVRAQTSRPARFLAISSETIERLSDRWTAQWKVATWGLSVRRLTPPEYRRAGLLGETTAVGGFSTPDNVMDFPRLIQDLRSAASARGIPFIDGVDAATLDLRGDRVVGVRLRAGRSVACDAAIVATGAWTATFLRSMGLTAPLVVKRCIVVTFDGEIVPCLTVGLDVRRAGGGSRDASLVPFKGRTLGAEADGEEVDGPTNEPPDPVRVSRLIDDYAACFPRIREMTMIAAHVCFKTEHQFGTTSPRDFRIYDRSTQGAWPAGLLVAIPGKASLGFAMAARVKEVLRTQFRE